MNHQLGSLQGYGYNNGVCPHCGRCQHCGGGGYLPQYPWYTYHGITGTTGQNTPGVTSGYVQVDDRPDLKR